MTQKALNMLGLCAKAGKLITGEAACEQAIKRGNAYVAIVDEGASQNARKAMQDACDYMEIPLLIAPVDAMGAAVGKPGRMAAAVTEKKMAARIIELSQGTENNRGCI